MLDSRICTIGGLLCRTVQGTSYGAVTGFGRKHRDFSTENKTAVNVPRAVLPSPRLITRFENKDIFLRLLLELEFLYEAAETTLPTYLTDNDWMKYAQMTSIIERCCYLHQLYASRKQTERKEEIKVLQADESGNSNNHSFNTLFCFENKDFRKFAYEIFGSRLLAAWRCNDSFPPLFVDCRYLADLNYAARGTLIKQMKDLVLDNSLQRNPFPIIFVNYRATTDLAQGIVNSWLRKRCLLKYRPFNVNESEEECREELRIDENSISKKNPCSAPFVPVFTSATIRECLSNTDPEEIAYINPRAAEYLPGPLSRYRAFALCATPENRLLCSSLRAARKEQLNSFKLPISQFLNLGRTVVTMPLRMTGNIIRDVYANGCEWRKAFEKHIPYFNILAGDMYQNHDNDRDGLKVLERWLSDAQRRGRRKRTHVHLYSREERRVARAALAALHD